MVFSEHILYNYNLVLYWITLLLREIFFSDQAATLVIAMQSYLNYFCMKSFMIISGSREVEVVSR